LNLVGKKSIIDGFSRTGGVREREREREREEEEEEEEEEEVK